MAWMAGSHAEGVACCVKHFPGHGDTSVDSHRDLPTVDKPVAELEPHGTGAVPHRLRCCTGHDDRAHRLPDAGSENPATMSRRILTDMLREEWQYQGIIITDGMDMHAIAGRYGVGNAAVRALTAGADMVMALGTTETQEETLDAIAAAIAPANCRKPTSTPPGAPVALARPIHASHARTRKTRPTAHHGRRLAPQPDRLWRPTAPGAGARVRLIARAGRGQRRRLGSRRAGRRGGRLAAHAVRRGTGHLRRRRQLRLERLPQDGRFTMLASTSRLRYGDNARDTWRPTCTWRCGIRIRRWTSKPLRC
jgi:beta-N-acetylhexosaminidase